MWVATIRGSITPTSLHLYPCRRLYLWRLASRTATWARAWEVHCLSHRCRRTEQDEGMRTDATRTTNRMQQIADHTIPTPRLFSSSEVVAVAEEQEATSTTPRGTAPSQCSRSTPQPRPHQEMLQVCEQLLRVPLLIRLHLLMLSNAIST